MSPSTPTTGPRGPGVNAQRPTTRGHAEGALGAKTKVLIEALPYISKYEGKTFVIKYGGAAMVDTALRETFAQDVTLLKKIGIKVVIVHGGGKDITEAAGKLGVPVRFVDGQRYTDEAMMDVVLMVLAGTTNKNIVARINHHDGEAVGICGIDADLLRVRKYASAGEDLGLVGEVAEVNTQYLNLMLDNGIMPVIAPVGVDGRHQVYNINADVASAAIAGALKAEKLVYLSDVEGVSGPDGLIHSMDCAEADQLIGSGIVSDGMIPKIRSAFGALSAGVGKVHMIDGRVRHSLLLEIFTDEGIGTELVHSLNHSLQGALT
jgi:acetylglutamate kinase